MPFPQSATSEPVEPPEHLKGLKRFLFTGSVARSIPASVNWVHELVHRGNLSPFGFVEIPRRGRSEYFLLFEPGEVERYMRSEGKPVTGRAPRQLNLMLSIPGGKKS